MCLGLRPKPIEPVRIDVSGPGSQMILILRIPAWKKEFNLTPEQNKMVDKVEAQYHGGCQLVDGHRRPILQTARNAKSTSAEINEQMLKLQDKAASKFEEILEPKQLKALKHIYSAKCEGAIAGHGGHRRGVET